MAGLTAVSDGCLAVSRGPVAAWCRTEPQVAQAGHAEYLYFIPVSARTVSCSDSPCRRRNLSSCLSSASRLRCPRQPAAGGQARGAALCFLPLRGASPGFCRLGLWGGMSAQEGLYRCMVRAGAAGTLSAQQTRGCGAPAVPFQPKARGEESAVPSQPRCPRCHELGRLAPGTVERHLSPPYSLYYCNWLILADARGEFWPKSAILFIC